MKFRVLFIAAALMALSTFVFAQPKSVSWDFPGDWDCAATPPLTYGNVQCFTGTPIPDGALMDIIVNGTSVFQWPLNGMFVCAPGYFSTNYFDIDAGVTVVLDIIYQNCHYVSRTYTIANDETFLMFQGDWTCVCDEPPQDIYDLGDLGMPTPFPVQNACFVGPQVAYPTGVCPGNGPGHQLTNIAWLGSGITAEAVPNIQNLDGADDGVVFNGPFPWLACTQQSVTVTVTGGVNYQGHPLFLCGWKDGNLDGDFNDALCLQPNGPASEWIIQNAPVVPGVYTFTFMDPGCPTPVVYAGIFRFRLTSEQQTMDSWMFGCDVLGEVEDYYQYELQLPVELTAAPTLSSGDRALTLSFNVADQSDVNTYEIWRDGVKVTELPKVESGAYTYADQNLVNGRVYNYTIVAVGASDKTLSYSGTSVWSGSPSWMAAVVTAYALHQNYPNPFNPSTEIAYDVLEATHVTLKVYNVMGQEVAALVNGPVTAGRHAATFNATGLTSGLYFYTITMGDFSATRKMLLVQ